MKSNSSTTAAVAAVAVAATAGHEEPSSEDITAAAGANLTRVECDQRGLVTRADSRDAKLKNKNALHSTLFKWMTTQTRTAQGGATLTHF